MRDFNDPVSMTEQLIENINKYVKEDDTLYHLGDWTFGGIDKIWEFRKRINCKNVHLILGNHDDKIKNNKILPNCNWFPGGSFIYNSMNYYQGRPALTLGENPVYAKELFTSVQDYLELTINKQLFVLSHHPFQEWLWMDRGAIHLHGHCHHQIDHMDDNMFCRKMDVGVDWEEFRPYSIDEILAIMKERKFKKHLS